ncbi:unnamed protein product [Periconia digitata]|uniref:Telomerase reverse transcriptase n=1 Tax=Periconia digitata TaxID=1303443 RepID=A0A9W4UU89_9PLEO|nr:unnamed protein product [Periconia digitata]
MKRKGSANVGSRPSKRPRQAANQSPTATTSCIQHPVLARLYPKVVSLRHYLLSQLPTSSKNRRRKIAHLGVQQVPDNGDDKNDNSVDISTSAIDTEVAKLLDSILVGVASKHVTDATIVTDIAKEHDQDLQTFSQQLSSGSTGGTFKPGYFLQAEIVDFVIWRLFRRCTSYKPSHLLCRGFQRSGGRGPEKTNHVIPGMHSYQRNANVETLKSPVWRRLHAVLGKSGERIMMDLLTDCGIFSPLDGGHGNYFQLSGLPLSEVQSELDFVPIPNEGTSTTKTSDPSNEVRSPSSISFVRIRMLYARAALNGKGGVRFGMRHIHVLNRCPDLENKEQTVHIMRYIFPRQYGLHNVFTSKVDKKETSMPFQDYTLREKEIQKAKCKKLGEKASDPVHMARWKSHVPKRLRGEAVALVEKMRKLNKRCSYVELLRHYCPIEGVPLSSRPGWRKSMLQPMAIPPQGANDADDGQREITSRPPNKNQSIEQTCFTDLACPTAQVSAFCRAVMAKVIPHGFWGCDHNRRIITYWVDQFICLRKFESLNLHQVTQKLQISTLAWLRPPGQDTTTANMAKSDSDKRLGIFLEFVYWIFDSFLIPLVRSNFHVTESSAHRHRLFYFRHDVWKMLAEPTLSDLRLNVYEEMDTERATRLLSVRPLGFSKIRLLPKQKGVRLITNLKRRQQITRNGTTVLGRSINSVMTPAFNIITFEKSLQPDKFGGSLFSIGDMRPRLTAFKQVLREQGLLGQPMYFAKVDVQSCFDSIPQKRLLSMIESLLSMQQYQTEKHVEISPLGRLQRIDGQYVNPLPFKRYVARGAAADESMSFDRLVEEKFVGEKANTIFVHTAAQHVETKDDLMQLLREHVERNVVKIGKKFYRQKNGIPQGSVLSTILCNFFYAQLEQDVLGFARGSDCVLLRLLDDFCLITTSREKAERFVQVMHRGQPEYGVVIKASKSLANFDVTTEDGKRIARCGSGVRFPYCGVLIDMRTLDVSKDAERAALTNTSDSLTVDLGKVAGQSFHRKALNAFKIQLQAMFIDTSFNSVPTVLANLYQSFHEAAVRSFEYARSLAKSRPLHPRLLIGTVESTIALAFVMLRRRTRNKAQRVAEQMRSVITRRQVQWLACKAFDAVFQQRQTQHRALLEWLRGSLAAVRLSKGVERDMLEAAVDRVTVR